jgi:hypothetical protein
MPDGTYESPFHSKTRDSSASRFRAMSSRFRAPWLQTYGSGELFEVDDAPKPGYSTLGASIGNTINFGRNLQTSAQGLLQSAWRVGLMDDVDLGLAVNTALYGGPPDAAFVTGHLGPEVLNLDFHAGGERDMWGRHDLALGGGAGGTYTLPLPGTGTWKAGWNAAIDYTGAGQITGGDVTNFTSTSLAASISYNPRDSPYTFALKGSWAYNQGADVNGSDVERTSVMRSLNFAVQHQGKGKAWSAYLGLSQEGGGGYGFTFGAQKVLSWRLFDQKH